MTIRLEGFHTDLASEVGELWYRSWLATGETDQTVSADSLSHRLLDEAWEIILAHRGEELAGFLAISRDPDILRQIFVAPEHQHTGVGRRMLDHAKAALPAGFSLRCSETNERARKFYEREGLTLESIDGGRVLYGWAGD